MPANNARRIGQQGEEACNQAAIFRMEYVSLSSVARRSEMRSGRYPTRDKKDAIPAIARKASQLPFGSVLRQHDAQGIDKAARWQFRVLSTARRMLTNNAGNRT